MKAISFATICVLTFVYRADCAITAWTEPVIDGAADGSAASSVPVAESVAAGADTGITVVATGAATYELVADSQTPATPGTFAVSSGGIVTFTGTLNYEVVPSYTLIIVATEDATNKGTATVTISITDVNESPAFAAASYGVLMNHGAASGKAVVTLTATDPDTTNNAISAYAISAGGNTGTDFAIDSSTGKITVANALSTDRTPGYALEVTAADSASPALTGTTTVYIVVRSSDAVAIMSGMVVTTIAFLVARFL